MKLASFSSNVGVLIVALGLPLVGAVTLSGEALASVRAPNRAALPV